MTVVKMTSNQSVFSQESSIVSDIPSELLKIPNMKRTRWQEKEKSQSNQKPRFITASAGEMRLACILTA